MNIHQTYQPPVIALMPAMRIANCLWPRRQPDLPGQKANQIIARKFFHPRHQTTYRSTTPFHQRLSWPDTQPTVVWRPDSISRAEINLCEKLRRKDRRIPNISTREQTYPQI